MTKASRTRLTLPTVPAVLDTAGYTQDVTKANINLSYACFQFAFALIGAAFVERVGRRWMMLGSMASCCVMWIGVTTATAIYSQSGDTNTSAAKASIACIFLFGAVFSIGITPLQALYPVEVLSFEMRAKGMGFSSLAVAIGKQTNGANGDLRQNGCSPVPEHSSRPCLMSEYG